MPVADIAVEKPQPAPDLRLLVELPSRPAVFVANLRDLIVPKRLPDLELKSAPAPFWPDVFVNRPLPWRRFFDSAGIHLVAGGLLLGLTHFFALQPRVEVRPAFDHSQLVYTPETEYLPPLDTRPKTTEAPRKADPEFARQEIISVPPEADNRSQTLVAPPNVKLKQDIAIPNIVAWSDQPVKPRLDIPAAPLTPAAEITRLAPQMNSVVAPPPDARLVQRRDLPTLQASVVAPPTDVHSAAKTYQALQPALIAPPPSVEAASRRVGELNIGHAAVIAPAPQLAVSEQRAVPGGKSLTPQLVAPPPSLAAAGGSRGTGSPGRAIALSLHPAVSAPPSPPPGNRRGSFAATPEGHAGASASPGAAAGNASGKDSGSGAKGKSSDLPSGLYVGNAGAKSSPVAGNPSSATAPANTVNPKLLASARPPRVSSSPMRATQSDASKLSEPERAVFGDRRFYSLTLNMPNLNSAGGSWVIRFAALKQDPRAAAAELSQPTATKKVDPAYPLQLMRENVAGTVIVYGVIRADGTVGNVRVLRGVDDRIDQFASQAVSRWQFQPATKNGEPVDVEATFQIPFRPPKVGSNF